MKIQIGTLRQIAKALSYGAILLEVYINDDQRLELSLWHNGINYIVTVIQRMMYDMQYSPAGLTPTGQVVDSFQESIKIREYNCITLTKDRLTLADILDNVTSRHDKTQIEFCGNPRIFTVIEDKTRTKIEILNEQ